MSFRLFGSLFSGAGLLDHAMERAGWQCLWQCENDAVARRVLARHWPDLECYPDVCTLDHGGLPAVDLLAGGFPCQDVSVAGCRAGLAGERSGLFFEFLRLADVLRPRWLLLENVPGLLSSCAGADFAVIVGEITGCRPQIPKQGWRNAGFAWGPKRGLAWRVLDAQYVGGCPLHADEWGIGPVPQRRRRVFLVAHSGDVGGLDGAAPRLHGSRLAKLPVQVLFESEGSAGHPVPSGEKGSDIAAALGGCSASPGVSHPGRDGKDDSNLVVGSLDTETGHTDDNTAQANHLVVHTLRAEGCGASEDGTGRGTPLVAYQCHGSNVGPMGTVRSGNGHATGGVPFIVNSAESTAVQSHARETETARCLDSNGSFATGQGGTVVAFQERGREQGRPLETQADLAYALMSPKDGGRSHERNISDGVMVRRLTPIECLRLMGMPDDWLDLDPPLSDSAKYRLVGNGCVRPVVEWIGRRILEG
jgi:DNA (cytosine-5)-methyltransferase 1